LARSFAVPECAATELLLGLVGLAGGQDGGFAEVDGVEDGSQGGFIGGQVELFA